MNTNNEITDLMPIITAMIAIISAYATSKFQFWTEKNKKEVEKRNEFKEPRYKAIILLMVSALNFEKNKPMLQLHGRNYINTIDDLIDELDTEWKNMILYANDKVIKAMGEFVKNPTENNFWKTTLEMRKDLYGIKTELQTSDFNEKIVK